MRRRKKSIRAGKAYIPKAVACKLHGRAAISFATHETHSSKSNCLVHKEPRLADIATYPNTKMISKAPTAATTGQPKQFHIFGRGISFSMSPAIHNTGFEHHSLDHNYKITEVETIEDCLPFISQENFGGASVTMPYKLEVSRYCDVLTPRSKAARRREHSSRPPGRQRRADHRRRQHRLVRDPQLHPNKAPGLQDRLGDRSRRSR